MNPGKYPQRALDPTMTRFLTLAFHDFFTLVVTFLYLGLDLRVIFANFAI